MCVWACTWRCKEFMRILMWEIMSVNFGTELCCCLRVILFSHSKWCSKDFKSAWSWERVGLNCKRENEKKPQRTLVREFRAKQQDNVMANYNKKHQRTTLYKHTDRHTVLGPAITNWPNGTPCLGRLCTDKGSVCPHTHLQRGEVTDSAADRWKRLEPVVINLCTKHRVLLKRKEKR